MWDKPVLKSSKSEEHFHTQSQFLEFLDNFKIVSSDSYQATFLTNAA